MNAAVCHLAVSLALLLTPMLAWAAPEDSTPKGSTETQEPATPLTREASESPRHQFRANLGYYGEYFTHPGVGGSLEYSLLRWSHLELASSTQVGWYRHPRNHEALLLTQNVSLRVYCLWDVLHISLMAGLGYFRRTPQGEVYAFEGGSAPVTKLVAANQLGINTGLGFGLDAPRSLGVPLSLYFNAWASWEYPFNGYVLLHPIIETGVSFRF